MEKHKIRLDQEKKDFKYCMQRHIQSIKMSMFKILKCHNCAILEMLLTPGGATYKHLS